MTLQHLDTAIAFAVVMLGASLLITILTQAVSTFFAYRGSNLRWGLKTLLKTVNPNLDDKQLKSVAQEILTNELISDSFFSKLKNVRLLGFLTRRWRLASAVRAGELVRILPSIANQLQAANPQAANPQAANDSAGSRAIAQLAAAVDPAQAQRIVTLLGTLRMLAPAQTAEAQQQIQDLTTAAQAITIGLTENVKTWFDSAMDRVSQRFVLQTRIWTVVFSALLAFAVHLDVFRLYTQLSSDAELRAKLVSSADSMTKQAAAILPPKEGGTNPDVSVVPKIYSDQMKELKKQEPTATAGLADPPAFQNREAAVKWLRDGLTDKSQADRLVAEYQQLVDNGLKSNADKLLDESTNVQNVLSKSGYHLIPDPYPQPWYTFTAMEFWGTLAGVGLLSLGAPFWFNALKTLSSLRPVVATKEEKERQQAAE